MITPHSIERTFHMVLMLENWQIDAQTTNEYFLRREHPFCVGDH
jgi:hypothetical protein